MTRTTRRKFLPQQNALMCSKCGRDWSKDPASDPDRPDDAIVIWTTKKGDRVVDNLSILCKHSCDRGQRGGTILLSQCLGIWGAWETCEELLSNYEWPAPMRRKLMALLRDGSKIAPNRLKQI
jgi:hypothetical protein